MLLGVTGGHIHCSRSQKLMAARRKANKVKRIHRSQDNRPAAALPSDNFRAINTQESQEYREYPGPSNHTNFDAYAYPYEHIFGRFMSSQTEHIQDPRAHRRTHPRSTNPPSFAPDLISPHSRDANDGYLPPLPHRNCISGHALQQPDNSASDPDYQELNENSSLAMGVTDI